MTLHVLLTPEAEDSISTELLMKTNMTRSGEMLEEYPGDVERRA